MAARTRIAALFTTFLLTLPLGAVTVYTTGAPDLGSGSNGPYSDGWVDAEFFTLAQPADINSVTFYSIEAAGMWDGTVDYFFFTGTTGSPSSSPFAQGHDPAFVKTQIGTAFGDPIYQYVFPIPDLSLDAGTVYWLGIHLKSDFTLGSGPLLWDQVALNPNSGYSVASRNGTFNNWVGGVPTLAFELDALPEPGTLWIAAVGLALCAGLRLRRESRRA